MGFRTISYRQTGEREGLEACVGANSFKIHSGVCAALWREDMDEGVSLRDLCGAGTLPSYNSHLWEQTTLLQGPGPSCSLSVVLSISRSSLRGEVPGKN